MPGPEGFMLLTKPLHQDCLSKSYKYALFSGIHHLAGRQIHVQLSTHMEWAGMSSVDNARGQLALCISKQVLLSWRWDRNCLICLAHPGALALKS